MDSKSTEAFWSVLQRLSGAAIVTTAHQGQTAGCYVGFLGGCSVNPPRMMVFMGNTGGHTAEMIERSRVLAVHLLGQGQEDWFKRFALQTGRNVDKLAGVEWEPGQTGSPVLQEAIGFVEGQVIDSLDCGDHTGQLVEPVRAELRRPDVRPLTGVELLVFDPWHEGPPPPTFQ